MPRLQCRPSASKPPCSPETSVAAGKLSSGRQVCSTAVNNRLSSADNNSQPETQTRAEQLHCFKNLAVL